jgi:triosephosphate isomerase
MMARKPIAISNWKMAMTIAESLSFVRHFQAMTQDILEAIDIVLCPPFTALYPVAQALQESRLGLGAQNMAPAADLAHTGEISAALLADVGCRWVMLGHWEVRRHLGEDDTIVNRKVHLALEMGLIPILLIGEGRGASLPMENVLGQQMSGVLAGCRSEQIGRMAFMYEPEGAIGASAPSSPEHVAAACAYIRRWLRNGYGPAASEAARIVYGGSVAPEFVPELLACPEIDGLAATRRGRDPAAFAGIVRLVARARTREF